MKRISVVFEEWDKKHPNHKTFVEITKTLKKYGVHIHLDLGDPGYGFFIVSNEEITKDDIECAFRKSGSLDEDENLDVIPVSELN